MSYTAILAVVSFARDVSSDHTYGMELLLASGCCPQLVAALLPVLEESMVHYLDAVQGAEVRRGRE